MMHTFDGPAKHFAAAPGRDGAAMHTACDQVPHHSLSKESPMPGIITCCQPLQPPSASGSVAATVRMPRVNKRWPLRWNVGFFVCSQDVCSWHAFQQLRFFYDCVLALFTSSLVQAMQPC